MIKRRLALFFCVFSFSVGNQLKQYISFNLKLQSGCVNAALSQNYTSGYSDQVNYSGILNCVASDVVQIPFGLLEANIFVDSTSDNNTVSVLVFKENDEIADKAEITISETDNKSKLHTIQMRVTKMTGYVVLMARTTMTAKIFVQSVYFLLDNPLEYDINKKEIMHFTISPFGGMTGITLPTVSFPTPSTAATTTTEQLTTTEEPITVSSTTTEGPTTVSSTTIEETTTAVSSTTTEETSTAVSSTTTEEPTTVSSTTTEETTTVSSTTTAEPTTVSSSTIAELTTDLPTTTELLTTDSLTTTEELATDSSTTTEELATESSTTTEKPTTFSSMTTQEEPISSPLTITEPTTTFNPTITDFTTETESSSINSITDMTPTVIDSTLETTKITQTETTSVTTDQSLTVPETTTTENPEIADNPKLSGFIIAIICVSAVIVSVSLVYIIWVFICSGKGGMCTSKAYNFNGIQDTV